MKILKTILDYIKTPKGQRNVLLVALILAIIFLRGCGNKGASEQEVIMYEQNIAALQDSVRSYKDKNGDLVYEKASLLVESKDLAKYNKELAAEVKGLKDNPIVIIKYKTKIVHDTLWLKPVIDSNNITFNADSTIKIIPFTWSDSTVYAPNNYRNIAGKYIIEVDTSLNVTTQSFAITKDELGITFTTGITENKDGLLEIFIKSPYPGFSPTAIDGALIDPRESDVIKKFFPPKRWSLGPYVGYGVYVDPQKATIGHGVQLGIGIQYGIFQWGGKK